MSLIHYFTFFFFRYKWVCPESSALCLPVRKYLWVLRMQVPCWLRSARRQEDVQRWGSCQRSSKPEHPVSVSEGRCLSKASLSRSGLGNERRLLIYSEHRGFISSFTLRLYQEAQQAQWELHCRPWISLLCIPCLWYVRHPMKSYTFSVQRYFPTFSEMLRYVEVDIKDENINK